jgi:hypothetical protein
MNHPYVILAVVLAFSGGALLGEWDGHSRANTACDLERVTERNKLVEGWAAAAEVLRQRGDLIDKDSAARDRVLTAKLQETQHALKTATIGRSCLGGAALRVLDHSTGLRAPDSSGALPGGSARPAANPEVEGEDVATDTDVAGWIAVVADYYRRAQERIRDIRRYETGTGAAQ